MGSCVSVDPKHGYYTRYRATRYLILRDKIETVWLLLLMFYFNFSLEKFEIKKYLTIIFSIKNWLYPG